VQRLGTHGATVIWHNRCNLWSSAHVWAAALARYSLSQDEEPKPLCWFSLQLGLSCYNSNMKRTRLLHRVLRDCHCRLQPSKIHGIGVFAVRDIPKGKNPFNTIPKYADIGYVRITEDELDALPSKLSEAIRTLFIPTDGVMHIPNHGLNVIRLNSYLNHSAKPNMRTRDGYDFVARRKILVGEELTVDYRTYGAEDLIAVS
jgi:hypothetical protein